jgi:peptidoglycan hydrolase-like protein with peptidoglycan-binding domain
MTLRMGDSIDVAAIPAGLDAYAGYVNGHWATYPAVVAAHPAARHLSISVFADGHADCLDVETGDATDAQAAAWLAAWTPGNTTKPVLYTSASNVASLLAAVGRPRDSLLVWSAHYRGDQHLCHPDTCGYPAADATQWVDHDGQWDESVVTDTFFPARPTPPPPSPPPPPPTQGWCTVNLPVLQQGSTGPSVRSAQTLLGGLAADGIFGPQTHQRTVQYQQQHHLGADGIIGTHTWGQLLGTPQ